MKIILLYYIKYLNENHPLLNSGWKQPKLYFFCKLFYSQSNRTREMGLGLPQQ